MLQTSPPTNNPPLQKPDFPWLGTHPWTWQLYRRDKIHFQGQFKTRETPRIGFGLPDYRIFVLHRTMTHEMNVWNQIHQKESQTDRCLKLRLSRYHWPDSLEESQVGLWRRWGELLSMSVIASRQGWGRADRVNIIQVICVEKYSTKNAVLSIIL